MKADHPFVSIITPSYNSKLTIEATVDSVKKQTFQDWEMIIVDDCSIDETQEKLADIQATDERIHIKHLEKNGGAAVARNVALQSARGRYIAFLDSDDCWKPEKLAKQIDFMKTNRHAFTFTGYECISLEGNPLNKQVHAPQCVTYSEMLKNTIIGCLTVIIDREQVGDFQMPNLRIRQDLATWLAILKKGITAYGLDEILAEYRVGNPNSISSNKWKTAQQNWYVYRQIEKLNLLRASWCFCHYAANAVLKRL